MHSYPIYPNVYIACLLMLLNNVYKKYPSLKLLAFKIYPTLNVNFLNYSTLGSLHPLTLNSRYVSNNRLCKKRFVNRFHIPE